MRTGTQRLCRSVYIFNILARKHMKSSNFNQTASSAEQRPLSEANSFSASRETFHILSSLKVHHRIHIIPTHIPIPNHMNTVVKLL